MVSSLVGAALSVTVLMGSLPALHLLEDIAVPFLVSVTTGLEITAFVFIYGEYIIFNYTYLLGI